MTAKQTKQQPHIDESTSLCDTKYKLVLLGDTGVGKTSIIQRFVRNEFDASSTVLTQYTQPTVGIDFLSRNITVSNRTYRIQLWDTAGQQKYKSLVPAYLRDANVALLVYDPTRPQTFASLSAWLQLFRDSQMANSFAMVVASKKDLYGVNQMKEEVEEWCKREELGHWQVSAKSGQGIRGLFVNAVESMASVPAEEDVEAEKMVAKLGKVQRSQSMCCP